MLQVSVMAAAADTAANAGIIAELIAASAELTTALEQHRNVGVAPELREQLAGFVATLRVTITTTTTPDEEDVDGDRADLSL